MLVLVEPWLLVKSLRSCTRPIVRNNTADIQRDIDGMTRSFTFLGFLFTNFKASFAITKYIMRLNTKQNILLINISKKSKK